MPERTPLLRSMLFTLLMTVMLLASPGNCFCQQFFYITYGYLDTDSVTVKEFRAQKELKVYNKMHLDSATAYFHIPGKKMITVKYRPETNSVKFKECLSLLVPGSKIGFDNIILSDSNNNKFQPHNLVNYYIVPEDHISHNPSKSVTEINRLRKLAYTSGKIYFKIPQQRPEVISFDSSKSISARNLFNRCTPESVIVFENVYYKDDKDRIKGPLNFTCRLK
jgi:hypothetical protein